MPVPPDQRRSPTDSALTVEPSRAHIFCRGRLTSGVARSASCYTLPTTKGTTMITILCFILASVLAFNALMVLVSMGVATGAWITIVAVCWIVVFVAVRSFVDPY